MSVITIERLPEEFLTSMKKLLGKEYESYLNSFGDDYYQGIRVNTSKISVEEFVSIFPFKLEPIPWTQNGFYVEKSSDISKHPYYYAGLYYIQEPSAMVPASRIPVEEGDRILDLCAAPGGKSTELSARLKGTGCLIANDISNSRAKALLKNLELFGGGSFCVCSESPEKLARLYPGFFDRILIDAPCSGEGMFRKDSSMLKSYQEHGPGYYAEIQSQILDQAYKMLKPGGNLLFSTCTFAIQENENNILLFLKNHPDMQLIPMEGYSDFSDGFERDEEDRKYHLSLCKRLFPHKLHGEGHFAALMVKADNASFSAEEFSDVSAKQLKLPGEWEIFRKELLCDTLFSGEYRMVGESLYLVHDPSAARKQIRFLRTGLYLGDCKKKRFEPSQALAMYLNEQQVKNCINLKADDERIIRYLKGETLELTEAETVKDGWILICVDHYPLGWGKVVNGTIRNKYYSGWRMN